MSAVDNNNWHQRITMVNNGQQCAVLHASLIIWTECPNFLSFCFVFSPINCLCLLLVCFFSLLFRRWVTQWVTHIWIERSKPRPTLDWTSRPHLCLISTKWSRPNTNTKNKKCKYKHCTRRIGFIWASFKPNIPQQASVPSYLYQKIGYFQILSDNLLYLDAVC